MAKKMELKNQIWLVNICLLVGLILAYLKGSDLPEGDDLLVILITGAFLFSLVNIIFYFRVRNAKKTK
jgi:divalent metal cation (Fe/Co/Zn/Cd) transporter